MTRTPSEDHRFELTNGRTIAYATWGDPEGTPVFIGHGTPGSRLALSGTRRPGVASPTAPALHRRR
jgi:pimeloyl-ACP methyl ester carboxylesterase